MNKLLSGLVITILMVACNNGETKADQTAAKPADTVTAVKSATDTVPSTLTTIVIPETPEAMAAGVMQAEQIYKTAKAMGDQPMADVSQKYGEYNLMLKEKFGNDESAKKIIKAVMEQCDKIK